MKRTRAGLLALSVMWVTPLAAQAQQNTGSIIGTVTDSRMGAPVEQVYVQVTGSNVGSQTDRQGRYLIQNVPAGSVVLVAQRLGYTNAERTVTVAAGERVTVDFQMVERALDLDAIVVTGTAGGTQRRAIGNVVAIVNADQVMATSPVGNVGQLLSQRTPGMMMLPGTGQVGTGSAIRIRGNSSLSLSNEPIIYIDGVRMDSDARRGPGQRGGANVSRLNDVHPSDIESIEIIKGPAAATLYGTEASNGVIQIITKRGATGGAQFDISTRIGTNWLWNPEGRTGMRYMPDPDRPGELFGFNVYEHERVNGNGPIFNNGTLQSYNLSMRGGADAMRYYASVSRDNDVGVVSWNWDKRVALRANMEMLLTDEVTATFSSAYIQGRTRLAQGAIDNDPFSNLIWSNPRQLEATRGWRAAPPEEWGKVEGRADNDRTTASVQLRYVPFEWLTNRVVAGIDLNSEVNSTLWPQQAEGASHYYGNLGLGSKTVARGARRFLTLDYSGSANFNWRDLSLQPSVGFQYYKTESSFINSTGAQFPAVPITTVSGGAVRDGGETFAENATVGVYVQQQFGWKNRAFLTAAIRGDDNSAFGEQYDAAIYPKLSAAWVVHEEPFWSLSFVDQFRLRAAWGAAGQQPGTFDAARLYSPEIGYGNQPALSPASFGNPQLKPERSAELELGFDATFLGGRLDVVYTRFQRAVKDAIVNKPLAPSSGFSGSQIVNIGQLDAWGNELGVTARLIQRGGFTWQLGTQYATTRNEIKSLGGLEFIGGAGQSEHREGYSIGDFFMRKILTAEINDQGQVISAMCDGGTGPQGVHPGGAPVPCAGAPGVFWAHTQPTWQLGVSNTVILFDRLTLMARVEGNGGHSQANTEIRAIHNQATSAVVLRGDDPFLQAYRVYENDATGTYQAGFIRLREVSATYDLPRMLVDRVGARNAALSLGMRNVAMLWTKEHGWGTPRDGHILVPVGGRSMITWDPEVRSTGQAATGYQTVLPPTASATMMLRISF